MPLNTLLVRAAMAFEFIRGRRHTILPGSIYCPDTARELWRWDRSVWGEKSLSAARPSLHI